MARVAEQAYRRGVQQGAGLAGKPSFRGDLWEWRYRPSLDLSPWIDRPTTTTSLDRLDAECGEPLHTQYRGAKFDLDDRGMTLMYSLPPVHGHHLDLIKDD